ncbi:hypothetical protein NLU13_1099 [Sarocladium strictum]|uniref:LysM domain-containing protein n=1 Tax=Sarocladium strictum TaxID=5046 RepID=A0AA39GS92_SARSR|nr:hypothetical protein NLU13_1099 [Sarocladium strictum]
MALFRAGLLASICRLLHTAQASPSEPNALRTRAIGFQAVPQELLDVIDLQDTTCLGVLKQTINCDSVVADLGQRNEYQGSLKDNALTDAVCAASCRNALTISRRRIAGACTSVQELLPGHETLSYIDSIISGWNETCLRDATDTSKYCNDIIDSWEEYDDLEEMPLSKLCSYCYGAKLRMMQESKYSAYNEYFAEALVYVNKKCGVTSPTEPITKPPVNDGSQPGECYSGNKITTVSGDTCDGIATKNSISSATLFYLNAHLTDCKAVAPGLELCLPEKCDTYQVQDGEDCVDVAVAAGVSWNRIPDWNAMIDYGCTNIHSAEPFWGTVLCVSAPGGEFKDPGPGNSTDTGNGNDGGQGGSGDGYADQVVDPPQGSGEVAKGTTRMCGLYVQAGEGLSCAQMVILANRATPMDLFLAANPSLGTALECDSRLELDSWYCLRPVRDWDLEQQPVKKI